MFVVFNLPPLSMCNLLSETLGVSWMSKGTPAVAEMVEHTSCPSGWWMAGNNDNKLHNGCCWSHVWSQTVIRFSMCLKHRKYSKHKNNAKHTDKTQGENTAMQIPFKNVCTETKDWRKGKRKKTGWSSTIVREMTVRDRSNRGLITVLHTLTQLSRLACDW